MSYVVRRPNGRYTALYNVPGATPKSAGTFATRTEAESVAREMEEYVQSGRQGPDPRRRQTITIAEYAWEWLNNHPVEPNTRANYASILRRHVLPRFGYLRVSEIQREPIRAYLRELADLGAAVATQRRVRAVFSAMLQTAWDDGYRGDNPVRGLRVQRGTRQRLKVMTVEQFQLVYEHLPTPGSKLFARFLVSTGCRLGEALCVTPEDVSLEARTLTISKSLQDIGREFHPNGQDRFRVAPLTKTGNDRTIALDRGLANALQLWIAENQLGASDLLFPKILLLPRRSRQPKPRLTPKVIAELEYFAAPNRRMYQHGTVNGYITGRCRCQYCRQAASEYSLERRRIRDAKRRGKSPVKPELIQVRVRYSDSPFMSRDRWSRIWTAACTGAGLPFVPTAYQVRHTHASWLISQGEDPKTVMTRLGHRDLSTTSLYVHDVGDDTSAAEIMDAILSLDR